MTLVHAEDTYNSVGPPHTHKSVCSSHAFEKTTESDRCGTSYGVDRARALQKKSKRKAQIHGCVPNKGVLTYTRLEKNYKFNEPNKAYIHPTEKKSYTITTENTTQEASPLTRSVRRGW